jgi:hypothetical protein
MSANAKISVRLSQDLANEKIAHKQTKDSLRIKSVDYTVLEEKYNAVCTTLQEELDKQDKLFNDGALFYYDVDGVIKDASLIKPFHNRTFAQDIDFNIIKSALYQRNPFYRINNGKVEIDKDKYEKYRRSLVL